MKTTHGLQKAKKKTFKFLFYVHSLVFHFSLLTNVSKTLLFRRLALLVSWEQSQPVSRESLRTWQPCNQLGHFSLCIPRLNTPRAAFFLFILSSLFVCVCFTSYFGLENWWGGAPGINFPEKPSLAEEDRKRTNDKFLKVTRRWGAQPRAYLLHR